MTKHEKSLNEIVGAAAEKKKRRLNKKTARTIPVVRAVGGRGARPTRQGLSVLFD